MPEITSINPDDVIPIDKDNFKLKTTASYNKKSLCERKATLEKQIVLLNTQLVNVNDLIKCLPVK